MKSIIFKPKIKLYKFLKNIWKKKHVVKRGIIVNKKCLSKRGIIFYKNCVWKCLKLLCIVKLISLAHRYMFAFFTPVIFYFLPQLEGRWWILFNNSFVNKSENQSESFDILSIYFLCFEEIRLLIQMSYKKIVYKTHTKR